MKPSGYTLAQREIVALRQELAVAKARCEAYNAVLEKVAEESAWEYAKRWVRRAQIKLNFRIRRWRG